MGLICAGCADGDIEELAGGLNGATEVYSKVIKMRLKNSPKNGYKIKTGNICVFSRAKI